MAYDEIQDMGRAVDKPKGFVKWSLIAYWTAILGLCGTIAVLARVINKNNTDCNDKVERVMSTTQKMIDDIRVDYSKKLEDRINRLEHVEERVDKVLPEPKNSMK